MRISPIGMENYAVWFSRGCKNNQIEDNHLYDLVACGIRHGESVIPPNDVTESSDNRIAGNYIHDGSIVDHAAIRIGARPNLRERRLSQRNPQS